MLVEEEEEATSLDKKIKDLMEAGIEELSKEIPFCREYETGKKEEPKGCDSSKVEEGTSIFPKPVASIFIKPV